MIQVRNYSLIVLILATAILTTACSHKASNKVEVLLPKECAIDSVKSLDLRKNIEVVEYVTFDNTSPMNKVFPGYLRMESSRNSKDHLVAVANRLTMECLPEEIVEYSLGVTGQIIGSEVAAIVEKSKNNLVIIVKDDTYKIIGKDLKR